MKLFKFFIILITLNSFGQEIKYNLMIKDPCSNEVEYGILYQLEKSGKTYIISDTIGTINLSQPGTYKLEASLYGIQKDVEIKNGTNIDTLFTKKIIECLEPVSHPNFIGFCCCDEKCDGFQQDYYNNGVLRLEGNFKKGLAIGKVIKYYSNGSIQEIRTYNNKGILKRTEYYSIEEAKTK